MCVLCMFYIDWELGGRKKLEGSIFLNKKLVRVGLQEINNFCLGLNQPIPALPLVSLPLHVILDQANMDWSPQTNYHRAQCKALGTPDLASV